MNSSAPGYAEANVKSTALAALFADGPRVAASDKAERRLNDWLAALEPQQAAALDDLLDRRFAKAILLGIVEFSPYLFDLVRADAARLIRLLKCDPQAHLAALIEDTSREVSAASSDAGSAAGAASGQAEHVKATGAKKASHGSSSGSAHHAAPTHHSGSGSGNSGSGSSIPPGTGVSRALSFTKMSS